MSGSKYTIQVDVTGNAEQRLQRLENAMGRVQGQANQIGKASNQARGELDKLGAGAGLQILGDKMTGWADQMLGVSTSIIHASREMTESIIADAAKFEDTQSSIKFAFGDKWAGVFQKIKEEAANLTFTFDEVANMAASLGRKGINPFGTEGDDLKIFKSKTGEAISALQVLQDVADGTGKANEKVLFGLTEALEGDWKSYRDTMGLTAKEAKAWQKEMDKAATKQEKYNILLQKSSDLFGGAGAMKARNWSKAIAQIPDLLQQIKAGIGAEGLKVMTDSMFRLVEAVTGFVKNKEAMKALSDAFLMVANVLGFLIDKLAIGVKWLGGFLKANPWVVKLAVALAVVVAVTTALFGAFLLVFAAVLGILALVSLIGIKLLAIAAAVTIALLPVLLTVGAVLGVIALLAYAVMQNLGGGKGGKDTISFLEKVQLVLSGIGELLGSYDGKTGQLSEKTARGLEKAGLLDFVTDLFKVYHRVRQFIDGFIATIKEIGTVLGPEIKPMIQEFKALIIEIAQAFGISDRFAKASSSSTGDWISAGRDLAVALMQVVSWAVTAIRFMILLARAVNAIFAGPIWVVRTALWAVGGAANFVYTIFKSWLGPLGTALEMIYAVAKALGLVQSNVALKGRIGQNQDISDQLDGLMAKNEGNERTGSVNNYFARLEKKRKLQAVHDESGADPQYYADMQRAGLPLPASNQQQAGTDMSTTNNLLAQQNATLAAMELSPQIFIDGVKQDDIRVAGVQ